MATLLFPGQASQFKGMGRELFGAFPEHVRTADAILGYSVARLCLEDPERQLAETRFTQPALYVVSALSLLARAQQGGARPDRLAGHSLGEYAALFAAGAFTFETGLRLVQKRGELMNRAAGGGMAAVVGLEEPAVAELLRASGVPGVVIANYNSPRQVVLAGPRADVLRVAPFVEEAGGTCIPLDVSGAFHSPAMAPAAEEFAAWSADLAIVDPTTPVISNVTARPHAPGAVRAGLIAQITSPVRWTETVRYLMGLGEQDFVEVGPGNVLTKLVQAIRREAKPLVLASPAASPSGVAPAAPTGQPAPAAARLGPEALGDAEFRRDHGLRYAYVTGSMYRGVSSVEMVVRVARAGMLGFFGSGGLALPEVARAIRAIRAQLPGGEPFGVNLVHHPDDPAQEDALVELFLAEGVKVIEASAFMRCTPALVRYRAAGLRRGASGGIDRAHRILAKASRPEVAAQFLSPAAPALVGRLLQQGAITEEQARLLAEVPLADDLCAEADSGGHTDGAVAYALTPAFLRLRDELQRRHCYAHRVRVGAAGGIGTPEAAAAALVLGAEFLLTGSINHCTVEAGTSAAAKDLLQEMEVQDTEYAPAGDMFELGAKVQVLGRGLFFPARANRLHELYRLHDSLEAIDPATRTLLEQRYFRRTLADVWEEVKAHHGPRAVAHAERNPKHKMALVFRAYFARSNQAALEGRPEEKVDYQIHCGPALGAFNQWVKGTELEDWRRRHVDAIGLKLLAETAALLERRFERLRSAAADHAPARRAVAAG